MSEKKGKLFDEGLDTGVENAHEVEEGLDTAPGESCLGLLRAGWQLWWGELWKWWKRHWCVTQGNFFIDFSIVKFNPWWDGGSWRRVLTLKDTNSP